MNIILNLNIKLNKTLNITTIYLKKNKLKLAEPMFNLKLVEINL